MYLSVKVGPCQSLRGEHPYRTKGSLVNPRPAGSQILTTLQLKLKDNMNKLMMTNVTDVLFDSLLSATHTERMMVPMGRTYFYEALAIAQSLLNQK